MTHDVSGETNINGAIFLDEYIKLNEHSQTIVLYSHNMRSGAIFGNLWQYEDELYFNANRMIAFDCDYGLWQFEAFAAGKFGTGAGMPGYLNILDLYDKDPIVRETVIGTLTDNSEVKTYAAEADNTLLVLITCVDEEDERRFVAAKRIR